MAGAVVEDESADERRVHVGAVLHLLDFDHVQIDRLIGQSNRQNRIHNALRNVVGQLLMELRPQRRSRYFHQHVAIHLLRHFERLQ